MKRAAVTLVAVVAIGAGCGASRSTHTVGRLPSGQAVEVATGADGRLCVVVVGLSKACGDQLTPSSPITFGAISGNSAIGTPPVAFGVTWKDVVSVSFVYRGRRFSIPVHDNFFSFRGSPSDPKPAFSRVAVTFANGTQKTIRQGAGRR